MESLEISNPKNDAASSAVSSFSFYLRATLNNFKQENSDAPEVLEFVHVHERCRDPFALEDKVRAKIIP